MEESRMRSSSTIQGTNIFLKDGRKRKVGGEIAKRPVCFIWPPVSLVCLHPTPSQGHDSASIPCYERSLICLRFHHIQGHSCEFPGLTHCINESFLDTNATSMETPEQLKRPTIKVMCSSSF